MKFASSFVEHIAFDACRRGSPVRRARFHVAAAERPYLHGAASHGGWITRLAERARPSRLPQEGELDVQSFAGTPCSCSASIRCAPPSARGITPGSAAYLFRGTLFLGDAATYSHWGGFAPAKGGFANDTRLAARSLERLWPRLPDGGVRPLCTAHARCTEFPSGSATTSPAGRHAERSRLAIASRRQSPHLRVATGRRDYFSVAARAESARVSTRSSAFANACFSRAP
jgi:hypothetical protein